MTNPDPDRPPPTPAGGRPAPEDSSTEVTIEPDGITAKAAKAETLLAALGRAGLRYRVGCRRGGCGICKVQLIFGEVRYERPIAANVLTDEERAAGVCLSCRAVPITNVGIALQEGDILRKVLGFAFPATLPAFGRAKDRPTNRKEGQS